MLPGLRTSYYEDQELLGGEGVMVEIDECKIGKKKCYSGRLVEGMIELNVDVDSRKRERWGGRNRLEICENNK